MLGKCNCINQRYFGSSQKSTRVQINLPTAHCLPHLCVGSALHRGTSPILSPGTLLLHCYYSASYLITLFWPGGVAGPPYTDRYPTAPSLLCGWSDGLEWSLTPVAQSALFLSS